MTHQKRPRGRPAGTGKNDKPYLLEVAEFLINDPKLKPTGAMRQVIRNHADKGFGGTTDETLIRRWQVKWAQDSKRFMSFAKQRAASLHQSHPNLGFWARVDYLNGQTNSPWAYNSPVMKQMRDYYDSPTYKAMQSYLKSPMYKATQEYLNSPIYAAMSKQAS